MIIGNKTDQEERRAVSTEEARFFAEQNNLLFIETSVLSRNNIDEAVMELANHIYENIEKRKYDLANDQCDIRVGNNQKSTTKSIED